MEVTGKEVANYRIRAHLSLIQHEGHEIVCNAGELVSLVDLTLNSLLKKPTSFLYGSLDMNQTQTYLGEGGLGGGSSFYVRW